jgi:hypothetical protein
MAITKHIQRLTHLEAVYKIINEGGAASTTLGLTTDLVKNNESIAPGVTPKVNISNCEIAIADFHKIRITRGGVLVAIFFENTGEFTWVDGADNQNNDQDLVIEFSGDGMIQINLLKIQGYLPNFRPEQGIF